MNLRATLGPNIYISAAYQRKITVKVWSNLLIKLGGNVISSWIYVPSNVVDGNGPYMEPISEVDIREIQLCNLFIAKSEDPNNPRYFSGGRHVELGIAIALNKPIHLIGERENAFHWNSRIKLWKTFSDFLSWYKSRGEKK